MIGLGSRMHLYRAAPVFHVGARLTGPTPGLGAGAGDKEEKCDYWRHPERSEEPALSLSKGAKPFRYGPFAALRACPERSEGGTGADHLPVTPDPITWICSDDNNTTIRSRNPPSSTMEAVRATCRGV